MADIGNQEVDRNGNIIKKMKRKPEDEAKDSLGQVNPIAPTVQPTPDAGEDHRSWFRRIFGPPKTL